MKPQSLSLAAVLVTAALAATAHGQGVQIAEQAGGYGMAGGPPAGPPMGGQMGGPEMGYGDPYAPAPPSGPRPFGADATHYLRFETMLLDRDVGEGLRLTTRGVNGDFVLETDQLEFEVEFATRVLVGLRLNDCCVLEASYFGLQNWEDRATATDPGGQLFSIYSDFGVDPPLGFANTDSALVQEIHYTSELHNAELNVASLRYGELGCGRELWYVAGLRYLEIQEGFDYLTIGAFDQSFTNVRTENDLVAFQMGLRYEHLVSCKLKVGAEVKGGVAVNMAELENHTDATISGRLIEHESDDDLSFLGEASLTGTYSVCPWLCLRGGYHVLYVDGLALAPNNFDRTPPASGIRVPVVDFDGSVLYHGATMGVELHW